MSSTTFVDNQTVISASWLNDVNNLVYNGVQQAPLVAPNIGVATGTSLAVSGLISGANANFGAPTTHTSSYTITTGTWNIVNGTASVTVTLPSATSNSGQIIKIKTIAAYTVVSASSNVVPLAGGSPTTAILAATAGKWATLVSDGTNWNIMESN